MKFELFGRLKKKGEKKEQPAQAQGIPLAIVENLFNRGLSEQEVIRELSSQGYSFPEIMDALNQVVKQGVQRSFELKEPYPEESYPAQDLETERQSESKAFPEFHKDIEAESLIPEKTEELIEIIVSEKLIDIEEEFEKIRTQLTKINKSISDIEARLKEIEIRKDEDEKKFITKIEELEEFLETSQSRIGGLEKALQQVLPTLVENMKNITNAVQEMKKITSAT